MFFCRYGCHACIQYRSGYGTVKTVPQFCGYRTITMVPEVCGYGTVNVRGSPGKNILYIYIYIYIRVALVKNHTSHSSRQTTHVCDTCDTSLETAIKMPAGYTVRNAIFQQTEKWSTFSVTLFLMAVAMVIRWVISIAAELFLRQSRDWGGR